MNIDGSNEQRLTNNSAINYYATWMTDGRILYGSMSSWDSNNVLYVMNSDGTGSQKWTVPSTVTTVISPVMSNDGTYIFYDDGEYGNNHIGVMYSDGTSYTKLGTTGVSPDYNPNP